MTVKISALPAASTPTGTELVPVVQGGVTSQTTVDAIALKSKTLAQLNTQVSDANIARTDAAQSLTGNQTFVDAFVLGGHVITDILYSLDGATSLDDALATTAWILAQIPDTLAELNTKISDATIARTDATQVFTGAQYTGVTTLAYAATIAVNAALHNAFKVTLTGAAILGNPTNAVEGMAWTVRVTQDATGSRALTFGTNYTVPTAISTASDAANSERLLTCVALSATKIIVLDSLGAAV